MKGEEKMKSEKWEKLASEVALETPFFTLNKAEFRRPNGTTLKDYYLTEKPASVHIAAITEKGKVVLIEHYRPGVDESAIEIPAGYIEKGETLESACERELSEEAGYRANNFLEIIVFTQDTSRYVGYPCHLFVAWNLTKMKERELSVDAREIKLVEISFEEAVQMIEKGAIKDLPTIAGILLAQRFYWQNKSIVISREG